MDPMLNIAIRAARKAGDVILRKLEQIDNISYTEKSPNDFVTEVDVLAEKEVLYHLQKAYPDHSFLSEEAGLIGDPDAEFQWIIDPIDGTNNFMHGLPHFCTSIALKHKSRIVQAVIYNPNTDQLFTASLGSGAQLNGRRIRVSKRKSLNGTLIGASPNKMHQSDIGFNIDLFSNKISGFRYGGSLALDLAYVGAGYLDACWSTHAKPWDIAAGILIVKEAGGMTCEFDGGENYLQSGNLITGNPKLVAQIMRELKTTAKA